VLKNKKTRTKQPSSGAQHPLAKDILQCAMPKLHTFIGRVFGCRFRVTL